MSFLRRGFGPGILLPIICMAAICTPKCYAQRKDEPVPGAVQFSNGMILRGMCSSVKTVDDAFQQRLELRMIDQGYRQVYVSIRHSESPVVNPNDWPNLSFTIPHRRTGARPMAEVIGAPHSTPFDSKGVSTIKLRMPGNRIEEIKVGVSKINELFADVRGLTHDWNYRVSLRTFPMGTMYPGFLERVNKFNTDPFRRLELVRILMKAERPVEAGALLDQSYRDFPELKKQQAELDKGLRSLLAEQLLDQIDRRHAAGQFELVRYMTRMFPRENLIPLVVVKVQQLSDQCEQNDRRIASLKTRLAEVRSEIQDDARRQQATEMLNALLPALDAHSLDRLAGFELLADAEQISPESQIALAVSGWLIGAEDSIRSLTEVWGLFRCRELLMDYIRTAPEEVTLRNALVADLRETEGVSVDRLASVIRFVPPATPVPLAGDTSSINGAQFQLPGNDQTAGCIGLVPPEYSTSRSYPLIVAFPPASLSPKFAIEFWGPLARLNGYIVAVPELYDTEAAKYDASAEQHVRFLKLMTRLKHSLAIDDRRVFVVGHGMGGEAAVDMATSHPERFAGVVPIAAPGRRQFQWTARNDVKMPWYIVLGGRQNQWLDRSGFLLSKLFRLSEQRTFSDAIFVKYPERGFESYAEEVPSVFDWMSRYQRNTWPDRIEAVTVRSTDTNWSWLKLKDIQSRFVSLDQPHQWNDAPRATGTISARLTQNNAIILRTLPGTASICLNPNLPGIDLQKPITILSGRHRQTVNYDPDIAHMLNEYRNTGDRDRLCHMRIAVE
jgi:pimeloyl-ACP methyl ester carboxylesterase